MAAQVGEAGVVTPGATSGGLAEGGSKARCPSDPLARPRREGRLP